MKHRPPIASFRRRGAYVIRMVLDGWVSGGRIRVNDEDFVHIGLERHQDTVADGDALVDPVTIGIVVFCTRSDGT